MASVRVRRLQAAVLEADLALAESFFHCHVPLAGNVAFRIPRCLKDCQP